MMSDDRKQLPLAVRAARESLGRRADSDNAPHTAECYRSGKWDDKGEVEQHVATAALAIEMYTAEMRKK